MKKYPLAVLYAAVLIDMMGFGIVMPVLPFYAESLGATPLGVTLLAASFSAMQLAAAPLWGRVSDRRGRRPLLIASLLASAVSYLLYGLASTLWLLLVSRLVAGAAGGTITIAQAYIADSTTDDDRARGMGHIGAASGLGVMLGPAFGGLFSDIGYAVPGFLAAGLCLVNCIAAYYFLPESMPLHPHDGSARQTATFRDWLHAMTRPPLSTLLLVYFLTISSFTAMTSVLALFLHRAFDIAPSTMGLVFALSGGSTVLIRGVLLGPMVRKFGERRTAHIGIIALGTALIGMPLMPSMVWVFLFSPMYAFGAGTLFPALASLVSRATDKGSQGSILGGSQVVGGLGRVLGPTWAGWMFQTFSTATPFHFGAVLVAAAGLISLKLPRPATKALAEPVITAAS